MDLIEVQKSVAWPRRIRTSSSKQAKAHKERY